MSKINWMDEVLDFAIEREIEANKFYTELAKRMEDSAMRKVFEEFAKEELGHKAKLEAAKAGQFQMAQTEKVQSLNIADYVVDVEPKPDMDYADALVVAMKKEKASYRLYLDLAEQVDNEELKSTLLWLAGEEANHKLRFEIEYDDVVLKED
jgi:rubrerythrin